MQISRPHLRYLRLLGFDSRPSGLAGLQEVVRRHICRVPFENVSKLLLFAREGKGRPLELEEFLDGIERFDLGGTCHSNNPFLAELLHALGYRADLLGADMSTPDVHTSVRVSFARKQYHIDMGYGAPFRVPIPLDRLPFEIHGGARRYVLRPKDDAHEMLEMHGTERLHGYVVHGPPRDRAFFHPAILDSFQPGTTFMSHLRIVRFFDHHQVDLRDNSLLRIHGREVYQTTLRNTAELRKVLDADFQMPRCPVEHAVEVLESLTGRSLFE